MSHDRGWRAACIVTVSIPNFHFKIHEVARGVTAMVVGSGALLGVFCLCGDVLEESVPRVNDTDDSEHHRGVNEEKRVFPGKLAKTQHEARNRRVRTPNRETKWCEKYSGECGEHPKHAAHHSKYCADTSNSRAMTLGSNSKDPVQFWGHRHRKI
ncbi:hypothetical protein [Horticoccus sp. 23ND18S-11]|uniref:hypothetical protein n=1 Tax=Horticoccus sp. 23ND18S-11 TaxID=3391832 RepID=UPI0039C946E3